MIEPNSLLNCGIKHDRIDENLIAELEGVRRQLIPLLVRIERILKVAEPSVQTREQRRSGEYSR